MNELINTDILIFDDADMISNLTKYSLDKKEILRFKFSELNIEGYIQKIKYVFHAKIILNGKRIGNVQVDDLKKLTTRIVRATQVRSEYQKQILMA